MEYNVQIVLTLKDDIGDISKTAKLFPSPPDVVAERGSRNPKKIIPRSSYMSFYSKADSWSASIEDHWQNFSSMLAMNNHVFLSVCKTADMKIAIIVDHKGRFPSLYLPSELISFAAKINTAIDIDVYEERYTS